MFITMHLNKENPTVDNSANTSKISQMELLNFNRKVEIKLVLQL